MTAIIDDFKIGLDAVFHPSKNNKQMSIGQTLGMYYKFSVVPFVLFIVLGLIVTTVLGSVLSAIPGVGGLATGLGAVFIVVGAIMYLLIAIPIGIIIDGILYYLVGGVVFKWFKNGLSGTVTGVAYSVMTIVGFIWLIFIPVIGWLIVGLLGLYSLWVLWNSLAAQHKATLAQAFIVWLVWVIVAGILYFAVFAAALGAVGALGGAGALGTGSYP